MGHTRDEKVTIEAMVNSTGTLEIRTRRP